MEHSKRIDDGTAEPVDPETARTGRTIDLALYAGILLSSKRFLALGALVGFVVGVLAVHLMGTQYTATMVVRPPAEASATGGGRAAALSSMLPGLSSLIGNGGRGDYDQFNVLLDSNELSERIVRLYPNVMQTIFKAQWNPETRTWSHQGTATELKEFVKSVLGLQPWHAPNAEDLRLYLRTHLSSSTDIKTSMTTLTFTAPNPEFARDLVVLMHKAADDLVRDQARLRSEARIKYLEANLPNVTQTDQHEILTQLLITEEQQQMMVQADPYFSAIPVDTPIIAQRPNWPPVMPVIFIFTVIGTVGGALYAIRRRSKAARAGAPL
jgi:uncharacterized protein involved in exopolysaccharide biosynthesis